METPGQEGYIKLNSRDDYYDPNFVQEVNEPRIDNRSNHTTESIKISDKVPIPNKSQVEIFCEDHKQLQPNLQKNPEAVRFCKKCNKLICDTCIIEYHADHIGEATTKIDEYCKLKKAEIENLKSELSNNLEGNKYLKEVDEKKEDLKKMINSAFTSRRKQNDVLIRKIQSIDSEYENLERKMIENIDSFFKEDCQGRIEKHINSIKSSKLHINYKLNR